MEKTRKYSGLFIIDPEQEEMIDNIENDIKKIVTENSGEVLEEVRRGKRKLSYPISKKMDGIYYELIFNALPAVVVKINRLCNINTKLLRTIISVEG